MCGWPRLQLSSQTLVPVLGFIDPSAGLVALVALCLSIFCSLCTCSVCSYAMSCIVPTRLIALIMVWFATFRSPVWFGSSFQHPWLAASPCVEVRLGFLFPEWQWIGADISEVDTIEKAYSIACMYAVPYGRYRRSTVDRHSTRYAKYTRYIKIYWTSFWSPVKSK